MYIQVMTFEDAEKFRWNPFDLTKVWNFNDMLWLLRWILYPYSPLALNFHTPLCSLFWTIINKVPVTYGMHENTFEI